MIRFGCPSCKSVMEAQDHKAGTTIACPRCRQSIKVPAPAVAKPAPPPQAPMARPVTAPALQAPMARPVTAPPPQAPMARPAQSVERNINPAPQGVGGVFVDILPKLLKGANPKFLWGGLAVFLLLLVIVLFSGPSRNKGYIHTPENAKVVQPSDPVADNSRPAAGPEKGVPELVNNLSSSDGEVRLQALAGLDRKVIVNKDAVEPLIKLLQEKGDSNVAVKTRQLSAGILGKIGPDAAPAIPHLVEAVNDANLEVRLLSIKALRQIGKTAIPSLQQILNSKDKSVQLKAAESLGDLGADSRGAVPAILDLMKEDQRDNRVHYASYIVKIDGTRIEVIPVLIHGLKDPNDTIRRIAATSLGEMGPTARVAADALYDRATLDINNEVRIAAMQALDRVKPK